MNNFKNAFIQYGLDHGHIKPIKKTMKKQLTNNFEFVCNDTLDTCAKFVRLKNDDQVEIEIIYRYSKPNNYLQKVDNFLNEHNNFYK